ncbi:hypothetical protein JCM10207_002016 [Rhodosporidiobolus poonsookiae]
MADAAKPTAKRSAYVSRACTACRRRKAKCDGAHPCASCTKFKDECIYSAERDARKSSSAAYVTALETRIKQLEQPSPSSSLASRASSAATASAVAELEQRNLALQSRILALERGLSTRGISISEVLEENRSDEPAAPIAIQAPVRRPSMLGKRRSSWGEDEDEGDEDEEAGWVEGFRGLQLSEDSRSLVYHGPSSALLHSAETECAASPPRFAPISASLDFSPSPFVSIKTPDFPPSVPLPFDLLGGASVTAEQPIDWQRYLPIHLGITREVHDNLLDYFEAFFAPWCMVIDVQRFRQDMTTCLGPSSTPAPTRTDFYSPMLHNAVLALACSLYRGPRVIKPFPPVNSAAPALGLFPNGPSCFLAEQAETLEPAELAAFAFYNQAKASLERECERPMLSTVRALLFIASFQSNLARCNLGYLYFGIAVRCAAALGVNISSEPFVEKGVITDEVRTARDNAFWTIYQQDSLWSLAVGRFVTLGGEDHEIALPPVDRDADAEPWHFPANWLAQDPTPTAEAVPTRLQPHSRVPSYASTTFLATSQLALIQSQLIRDLYSLKYAPGSAEQVEAIAKLSHRLEAFAASLPAELQIGHFLAGPPPPHVITLQLTFQKTLMLLHRTFYHRPNHPSAADSIKRCDSAAQQVVKLISLYDSLYGICYGPLSNIQTMFIAGTVLLLSARRSMRAAKRLKASLEGAETCCTLLQKAAATWKWADRNHRILRALVRKWTKSADDSPSSSPTAASDLIRLAPAAAPYLPPSPFTTLSALPDPSSYVAPPPAVSPANDLDFLLNPSFSMSTNSADASFALSHFLGDSSSFHPRNDFGLDYAALGMHSLFPGESWTFDGADGSGTGDPSYEPFP